MQQVPWSLPVSDKKRLKNELSFTDKRGGKLVGNLFQLPENGDKKIKKKDICEQHVTRQERGR